MYIYLHIYIYFSWARTQPSISILLHSVYWYWIQSSQSAPKLRRIKRHISQEIKEWDEETDNEDGHGPEELTWGFMEDTKDGHKPGHVMLWV